ncbi:HIT family protein [Chloroflexota bacterium]
MSDCIFCDIVRGTSEAAFVHRDDIVSVFMDLQPINSGHVLVIPNKHSTYLADLDPNAGAHIFLIAQQMAKAIRESGLPCEGVNFFLADGETAGQEIFHVHLHVFPRTKNDGFYLKVGDSYYTKPSRAELKSAARQIRNTIK